jgi:hypothetical protein
MREQEIKTPPQCQGCWQVIWQGFDQWMIWLWLLCNDCKALLNQPIWKKQ